MHFKVIYRVILYQLLIILIFLFQMYLYDHLKILMCCTRGVEMYNIRLTCLSTSLKQLIFSPGTNVTAAGRQNVSRVISGYTKDAI